LHGKAINSDKNISLKLIANNVAENDEAILCIPYSGLVTSSAMYHNKHEGISAFSVWTRCRFCSAIVTG
jgi:hypothetical protein